MKLINFDYLKYLIVFLPFSIALGRFTTDVTVILIGLFFIIYTYIQKIKIPFIYFFVFTILFYIYILTRSIFSSELAYSLHSSLFYFRFIFYAYGIYLILNKYHDVKKKLFISFILIYLFLIFDSYLQYFYGKNILSYEFDGTRVTSIFDEKILGSYIVRTSPIFIFLLVNIYNLRMNINNKLFYVFIFLLTLLDSLILISGERTAFALLIIFNLFIMIVCSKNIQKLFLYKNLISIFIFTLILFVFNDVKNRVVDETISSISSDDQFYIFSPEYDGIYKSSINVFNQNPLFGHGPRLYNKVCNKYDYMICGSHSHNSYLQLLSETGLIGFIFLFSIFLYISYNLLKLFLQRNYFKKLTNYHDEKVILLSLIFINIFPFSANGNFFGNWISAMYFLPIGFYFYISSKHEKNH